MSPTKKSYAPACCADNEANGFVLAVDVYHDGDTVRGTEFQMGMVDAVGVTHCRSTLACPLCHHNLWRLRCAELDAWVGDSQSALEEAIGKVREAAARLDKAAKERS